MKSYFQNIEAVVREMGVKAQDCHPGINRGSEYHQLGFGVGAVSLEEALCLAGLIFVTRPDTIIELGTETGASALVLGAAAKDLGCGRVFTVDKQPGVNAEASKLAEKYSLPIEWVTGIDSISFLNKLPFDKSKRYFVFSDTDIKVRPDEVELCRKILPKGTVIAIHDTSDEHPYGPMNLKEKIHKDLELIELPSPRGLTVVKT